MAKWSKQSRARSKVGKGNFNKVFGRHGLHHEFRSGISIDVEDDTKNTFILPLLACDKTLGNPDTIYVNPRNSNKTNSNDHLTYGSSVVKRIHYNFKFVIDPAIADADIYKCRVQCMPIMLRYDDLDKESIGETIGSYLPVVEEGSDEKILPNWSGVDFNAELSNFYDADELTTDAKHESVAFDHHAFETALAEKPISPLLLSATAGGLKGFDVYKRYPMSFSSTMPVPKKCQLQTEHTFFGLLIHIPITGDPDSYYLTGDITGAGSVRFNYSVSYYEWNKEYNQNVS